MNKKFGWLLVGVVWGGGFVAFMLGANAAHQMGDHDMGNALGVGAIALGSAFLLVWLGGLSDPK